MAVRAGVIIEAVVPSSGYCVVCRIGCRGHYVGVRVDPGLTRIQVSGIDCIARDESGIISKERI